MQQTTTTSYMLKSDGKVYVLRDTMDPSYQQAGYGADDYDRDSRVMYYQKDSEPRVASYNVPSVSEWRTSGLGIASYPFLQNQVGVVQEIPNNLPQQVVRAPNQQARNPRPQPRTTPTATSTSQASQDFARVGESGPTVLPQVRLNLTSQFNVMTLPDNAITFEQSCKRGRGRRSGKSRS